MQRRKTLLWNLTRQGIRVAQMDKYPDGLPKFLIGKFDKIAGMLPIELQAEAPLAVIAALVVALTLTAMRDSPVAERALRILEIIFGRGLDK
jgi:hypothetical protein